MHVGVNLLWLVPGRVGGSEEYLTRQLAALRTERLEIELTLFVTQGFRNAHPELASLARVVEAPIDGASRPRRVRAEMWWLPNAVRASGVSLMHHGGGTVPVGVPLPSVLTIHDLQYFTFPGTFSTTKLRWLRFSVPRSVRRASVITTPSRWVADDVIARFGVAHDRVVVVPNAAPLAVTEQSVTPAKVRSDLGLPGRFIVYPAITYDHKNHVTLLRAMVELRNDHPDLRLVLLGGRGPADGSVETSIDELRLRDVVVRPGRVPDATRNALYREASALAFPSRYEGFGIPVLEAFAHGLPVVAANATALPEAVGDAGVLVDPLDSSAWAAALRTVLADPGLAERLRAAGTVRLASYSAAGSAAALADAYGRVPL
jgi:glycosyltransferase involved in cell wall biosynthesis